MEKPTDLWENLCSYDNLFLAYKKARKHKTTKDYVIEFEKNLKHNLLLLRYELLLHCYKPKPLINFIVRDPKTRKISKSDFRDRIIHHALVNILEPIFDKAFIYDSYANRKTKGTLKAIQRFDNFKRKVSKNNTVRCCILKADIRKYFDNVDHKILVSVIKKKIFDKRIIWLIRKILENSINEGKGMPLGNLTSQFFANIYLNELDQFIKQKLRLKYYIRYVDDFVILHNSKERLERIKVTINKHLKKQLNLELHPDKSKINRLTRGTSLLGFRVFYFHKLLKKSNIRKMDNTLQTLKEKYYKKEVDYDGLYDFLEGWVAYTKNANAFILRRNILTGFEKEFVNEVSTKEINRHLRLQKN